MKKSSSKRRKLVGKAMISFVAILAVLTFFSNTIMNATIPRVMASNASRNNLSYTNNATAQLVAADEVKVKGLDGRTVGQVLYTNYDWVEAGDVVIMLAPLEDMTTIEELQTQLEGLLREQAYANRAPHHPTNYTSYEMQIHNAELAVDDAQADVVAAQNRDAAIAAAQQILTANRATLVSLEAQLTTATATLEGIIAEIDYLTGEIAYIDEQIAEYNSTPGRMTSANPDDGSDNPPENTPVPEEPEEPTVTPVPTATPIPTAVPTSTPTTAPTTAPTSIPTTVPEPTAVPTRIPTPTPSNNVTLEELLEERAEIQAQIATLQAQLPTEQSRVDGLAAQIVVATDAIETAQAALTEAESVPTIYAAQDALILAQIALEEAQIAYSDQVINDGIAADQAVDAANDRQEAIDNLEERIAELEAELNLTEIVAPISGYIFNMSVDEDDLLSKDEVVFTIVPEDSEFTVSFNFTTEVAETMSVGQELNSDNYYWIDRIVITNIKPDPDNPRNNRIVKCQVISSSTLWPGESITVTADRGNSSYDHVIAASAINEDNSGTFVFVIDKTSGPLGDRYNVRRVTVSVEARSGSLVAISGEGLDGVMIVTRSEEPLTNGDRVRLEDYTNAG